MKQIIILMALLVVLAVNSSALVPLEVVYHVQIPNRHFLRDLAPYPDGERLGYVMSVYETDSIVYDAGDGSGPQYFELSSIEEFARHRYFFEARLLRLQTGDLGLFLNIAQENSFSVAIAIVNTATNELLYFRVMGEYDGCGGSHYHQICAWMEDLRVNPEFPEVTKSISFAWQTRESGDYPGEGGDFELYYGKAHVILFDRFGESHEWSTAGSQIKPFRTTDNMKFSVREELNYSGSDTSYSISLLKSFDLATGDSAVVEVSPYCRMTTNVLSNGSIRVMSGDGTIYDGNDLTVLGRREIMYMCDDFAMLRMNESSNALIAVFDSADVGADHLLLYDATNGRIVDASTTYRMQGLSEESFKQMATGPDNIVIYVGPYWDNSHLMIMRPANLGLTIAVSPTPNQVVLRWTPLATATAYTIEAADSPDGEFRRLLSVDEDQTSASVDITPMDQQFFRFQPILRVPEARILE